jgi:hypothetical protein
MPLWGLAFFERECMTPRCFKSKGGSTKQRSIAAKSLVTVFAHVEPEIQTVDITFADVKRPKSPAASHSLETILSQPASPSK